MVEEHKASKLIKYRITDLLKKPFLEADKYREAENRVLGMEEIDQRYMNEYILNKINLGYDLTKDEIDNLAKQVEEFR